MDGPLRVGIDRRTLDLKQGTGTTTYAATLAAALPPGHVPHFIGTTALARPLRYAIAALPALPLVQDAHGHHGPDIFRAAQSHLDLTGRPLALFGRRLPGLMHWTYPLPLHMPGRPNLVTVHDLIPLLHPTLTPVDPARMRRVLAAALRHATLVVAVSRTARDELIRHLGLPPGRVVDTGQAVDVTTLEDPALPQILPGRYFLHVGTVERRKNLPRLVAAWRAAATPHPLVIAGPDGWHADETAAAIAGDPAIHRVPFLPRPRLLGLIRGARALLMPSLAEGFGLPVAEAMALGTPVLTSHAGALAEVAGTAALLVDPMDTAALAAAIQALDSDEALRHRLAASGPAQAAPCHPTAYRTRLDALYARAASERTSLAASGWSETIP